MTLLEFRHTLNDAIAPPVSPLLKSLWYDARGEWDNAHELAQEVNTLDGSWIHAYLHRKEGDLTNAQYWYSRANRKMPAYSLEQEWEEMVIVFLSNT